MNVSRSSNTAACSSCDSTAPAGSATTRSSPPCCALASVSMIQTLATELQRRAAAWHAARGMTLEAAEFARAAGDWALLGQLLGRRWLEAVLAGDDVPSGVLTDVPPSVSRPRRCSRCLRPRTPAPPMTRSWLGGTGARSRTAVSPPNGSTSDSVPLDVAAAIVDVLHGCAFGGSATGRCRRTMAASEPRGRLEGRLLHGITPRRPAP